MQHNDVELDEVLDLIERNLELIEDMSKALVRYAKTKERMKPENARFNIYEIDEIIDESRENISELMGYVESAEPDELLDILSEKYTVSLINALSDDVIESLKYATDDTYIERYDEMSYVITKEYNRRKMNAKLRARSVK